MRFEDLREGQMLIIKDIDTIIETSLMCAIEIEDLKLLHNGCQVKVYDVDEYEYFEIECPYNDYVIGLFDDVLPYFEPVPDIPINIDAIMKQIVDYNLENVINKSLEDRDYVNLKRIVETNYKDTKQT